MSLTRSSATVRVGLKPGGNRSGAGKISSRRGYRSVLYVSWIVLSATCASRLTSASTGRAPARSPCQNHPCCHGLSQHANAPATTRPDGLMRLTMQMIAAATVDGCRLSPRGARAQRVSKGGGAGDVGGRVGRT